MRILLLLSESWNDKAAPNNNMTNWFQDFPDAEIWTISGSSQLPDNRCCANYFLISENKMLLSLFSNQKSGIRYQLDARSEEKLTQSSSEIEISRNKKIKKVFAGEAARLMRDIVWRFGKYDVDGLEQFIQDFNPDIVFTQRRGSVKMCRLEMTVAKYTSAPIVAYTGDDEYSLHQFSLSPIFWIRRFWVRAWLNRTIPMYKLFYSQSERQMREFEKKFGTETKFLVKCGKFESEKVHTQVNSPIRLVYAGKLYCNRWKTLAMLADSIRRINEEYGRCVFCLDIYTGDQITEKQNALLNDGVVSTIKGFISAEELKTVYDKADIALHVESFDLHNRLLTQDSFSTKVMDCLASGCAVMAICWDGHSAYQYLKKQGSAFTASSEEEIYSCLKIMAENPVVVKEYAWKAFQCGMQNHSRDVIQKQFISDFTSIIEQNRHE